MSDNITRRSNISYNQNIFMDAVRGAFKGIRFMKATGIARVLNNLPAGAKEGDILNFPYYNALGPMTKTSEAIAVVPEKLTSTGETVTVQHASKTVNMSHWTTLSAQGQDPDAEVSDQFRVLVEQHADRELIATAAGGPSSMNVTQNSDTIQYDFLVDLLGKFGDEEGQLAGFCLHSKLRTDLRKIKDSTGRPIFVEPVSNSDIGFLLGKPAIISDNCAQTYPVVDLQSGGTGPAGSNLTFSGRLMGYDASTVTVKIITGGAVGVATFQYSTDGGTTYSATTATASSVVLGSTGLTLAFAAGTYVANEVYTAVPRFETLLCKQGALVLWNQEMPRVLNDIDIESDVELVAMHYYYAVYLMKRLPGSTRGGVAKLVCK